MTMVATLAAYSILVEFQWLRKKYGLDDAIQNDPTNKKTTGGVNTM